MGESVSGGSFQVSSALMGGRRPSTVRRERQIENQKCWNGTGTGRGTSYRDRAAVVVTAGVRALGG